MKKQKTLTAIPDKEGGLQDIVRALEYLISEADRSGQEDVKMIIESAFKLCLSIHYMQHRGEYLDKGRVSVN